ncbi:MAG: 16S rRNA (cytosine(1402)-N(4))-methyltransferase RsmH [Candidatus Omnitrophica bacterium]|nr:16S rRNA (cytosine(1402)-N(4))-methyltransferase RsmH [Candidatus Omnitrophota bacterium]
MAQGPIHIPAMPQEAMRLLDLPSGGTAVDGTLGLGGHAVLMAERLAPDGHLIGIDRDRAALAHAKERLAGLDLKIDLVQGNFKDIGRLLEKIKVQAVNGVLLDLGISSFQLNDPKRGFAFSQEGPLDMRMDAGQGDTAEDLVNRYSEAELARIIREYGEERFAKRIAKAIVYRRAQEKITTTAQLAGIILRALPRGYTRGKIHPATRAFQALRIVVNDELDSLAEGLEQCLNVLKPGGRLCVIAFHSLEDRIVKNTFRRWVQEGRAGPLTKKPLQCSEQECEANPRGRSARVRAIQRIL